MFAVGTFFTNCYIVNCEKTMEAIIIDPGFDDRNEAERILKFIEEKTLKLKAIVDTHGHPDHTCGNGIVKEKFHVPILIHEDDAYLLGKSAKIMAEPFGIRNFSPPANILLHEGDKVQFGRTSLEVMHTPGHSAGSISLIGDKEVFTGDTLFAGSIGRTDFPESSDYDMTRSLEKLASLPDDFAVYPGHGPTTKMSDEKSTNPFLQSLKS
jgi:hydroxyacylglutathione hydrolase